MTENESAIQSDIKNHICHDDSVAQGDEPSACDDNDITLNTQISEFNLYRQYELFKLVGWWKDLTKSAERLKYFQRKLNKHLRRLSNYQAGIREEKRTAYWFLMKRILKKEIPEEKKKYKTYGYQITEHDLVITLETYADWYENTEKELERVDKEKDRINLLYEIKEVIQIFETMDNALSMLIIPCITGMLATVVLWFNSYITSKAENISELVYEARIGLNDSEEIASRLALSVYRSEISSGYTNFFGMCMLIFIVIVLLLFKSKKTKEFFKDYKTITERFFNQHKVQK